MSEIRQGRSWESLTRGTGVTTTVNIQPGRPADCEFLLPAFEPDTKQAAGWFKASFDVLLKVHQVRDHAHDRTHQVTHSQKPNVKTKVDSVRARLDRIGGERDATRDADELKRRKNLFECVLPPSASDRQR